MNIALALAPSAVMLSTAAGDAAPAVTTIGVTLSRSAVIAPGAVHFEPAGLEALGADADTVLRHAEFFWRFSEEAAEDYLFAALRDEQGLRTPATAGAARGPFAKHAYLTAARHVASLLVYFNGRIGVAETAIEVIDPDDAYGGARTVYLAAAPSKAAFEADPSAYGAPADSPADCCHVELGAALTEAARPGRGRLLLRRGDVFAVSPSRANPTMRGWDIDGCQMIDAYGDAAAPAPIVTRADDFAPAWIFDMLHRAAGDVRVPALALTDASTMTVALRFRPQTTGRVQRLFDSPDVALWLTTENAISVRVAGVTTQTAARPATPGQWTSLTLSVDTAGGLEGDRSVDLWIDGARAVSADTSAGMLDLTPATFLAGVDGADPADVTVDRWLWAHSGGAVQPDQGHRGGPGCFFDNGLSARNLGDDGAVNGVTPLFFASGRTALDAAASGRFGDVVQPTNGWTYMLGLGGSEVTVANLQFQGAYDPAAPSAWDGVNPGTGDSDILVSAIAITQHARHATIFRCGMRGMRTLVTDSTGPSSAADDVSVIDCVATDWYDYACFLARGARQGMVGCNFQQNRGAVRRQGLKTENQAPYWDADAQALITPVNSADHGPSRMVASLGAVWNRCRFFSSSGWSGGRTPGSFAVQPCVRAAMSETPDQSLSLTECHFEGGGTIVAISVPNGNTLVTPARALVVANNYLEGNGATRSVIGGGFSNIVARGNIIYFSAAPVDPATEGDGLTLWSLPSLSPPIAPGAFDADNHFHGNTIIVRASRPGHPLVVAERGTFGARTSDGAPASGPAVAQADNTLFVEGDFDRVVNVAFGVETPAVTDDATLFDAFYRPLAGVAVPVATSASTQWGISRDFAGLPRPGTASAGALETATTLPGWTPLPSPPAVELAWSASVIDPGDVLGRDVRAVATIVAPGEPPLNSEDVGIKYSVNGVPAVADHICAPGETISAQAQWVHPVTMAAALTTPTLTVAGAPFIPGWVRGGHLQMSSLGMGLTQRMTLVMRIRPAPAGVMQILFASTIGLRVTSQNQLRLTIAGGPQRTLAEAAGAPLSLMMAVDAAGGLDPVADGGASLAVWINGAPVALADIGAPAVDLADATLLALPSGAGETVSALREWVWLSDAAALSPAAHWGDFFEPDGEVRNLAVNPAVAGVPPTVFVTGLHGLQNGLNTGLGANVDSIGAFSAVS